MWQNQSLWEARSPVHAIGRGHPALTGPLTEDTEAADATNPSLDQAQDPELLLHSEAIPKNLLSQYAGEG